MVPQSLVLLWGKDSKGFGFALSAWFIVANVKGYFCGVSLILNA